jgi:inner membrane protein involved in colicin E2 resistance
MWEYQFYVVSIVTMIIINIIIPDTQQTALNKNKLCSSLHCTSNRCHKTLHDELRFRFARNFTVAVAMDLANGQAVSTVPAGPSLQTAELITFWVGPAF